MRISLNLATRPFADLGPAIKRLRIAMAALAVIAIALSLGLRAFHQKAEEARAHDHSLDGQIARINQERQGYQNLMRQPENAQLLLHVGALNQLFDEKAFSWTLAMEDLETVLPGGVQASTLEPVRDKEGKITLRLRVIGPRDKSIELVRNLERSKRFLLPRIVGESSESSSGPNEKLEPVSASSRVNFELLADYNPDAPIEPGKKPISKTENTEIPVAGSPAQKFESPVMKKPAPVAQAVQPSTTTAMPNTAPGQPARLPFSGQSRPTMPVMPPNQRLRMNPNPNAGGPQ